MKTHREETIERLNGIYLEINRMGGFVEPDDHLGEIEQIALTALLEAVNSLVGIMEQVEIIRRDKITA